MQDIENDMDGLFRRASEKYPLNTGQSNWESVEKILSAVEVSAESQEPESKNNYKKLLLLFLLICISMVLGFLILNSVHKNYKAEINDHQTKQNDALHDKANATENASVNQLWETSKGINRRENNNKKSGMSMSNTIPKKIKASDLNQSGETNENNFSIKNKPEPVSGIQQQNKTLTGKKADRTAIGTAADYQEIKNKTSLTETIENKSDTEIKKAPGKDLSSSEQKNLPSPKNQVKKETRFYAGFMAGPDFSKVKSTAFSNPGFSVGLLAGYNISKTIFVETGFLSDTKYYSSKGEMFNKESASMSDEMTVNDLESRSKILEIPLKIGYRFYNTNNTNFFAAAGLAAYLMTEEKNKYNITENGTPAKMEGLYKKNDLIIPAVFNISIGWEQQLSGLLGIRIEPYLKLPLQGIGVGKLPVTSAGIQIGLIRDFK